MTLCTVTHEGSLSMGFPRQEYWSGVPLPSPWQIWKPPNEVKPYRLHIPLHYATILLLVTKSCLTLCNPMDYSPQGSSVPGISQARILEWVAIPFTRGSSQPRDRTQVSHIAGRYFTSWATGEAQGTLTCLPWVVERLCGEMGGWRGRWLL